MSKITLIDCTLRDGGYYNKWDFPLSIVQKYLDAMVAAQVNFVEIGFRGLPQKGFLGGHAFSTDNYLSQLRIPKEITLGVMINAADLLSSKELPTTVAESLFPKNSKSVVSLVRIACHFHEYLQIIPVLELLKERGYFVGLNLMQIASRSTKEISQFLNGIENTKIDMLYIADSTGSLTPRTTKKIIKQIKARWDGNLGVHMHDNQGLAIQNSLIAIENGANFVDSTVTGMGRGPGNAQTEYIVCEKNVLDNPMSNPTLLLRLIDEFFMPMKKQFGWGKNYFYYQAGKHHIHPTYIQEMIEDQRYGTTDIINAIEFLKKNGGKYDREVLDEAFRSRYSSDTKKSWNPRKMLNNREVLIIASGPSIERHCSAIEYFIQKYKPFVIALNAKPTINERLIDARAACNPKRIISDIKAYRDVTQPIIMPLSSLNDQLELPKIKNMILDFGLEISGDIFECTEYSVALCNPLSLGYALGVAGSGGSSKTYLAGVDGFSPGDRRNTELEQLFKSYKNSRHASSLVSITPTLFDIAIESVYSFK